MTEKIYYVIQDKKGDFKRRKKNECFESRISKRTVTYEELEQIQEKEKQEMDDWRIQKCLLEI